MKPIAGILSLIIGLLMIQPLLIGFGMPPAYETCSVEEDLSECGSQTSCNRRVPCESENEDDTKGCNPLLGCTSGNFYVHSYSTVSLNPLLISKAETIVVNDNRLQTQLNECWHPPELI